MTKTTENAGTTNANEARSTQTAARWRKPLVLYAATWATTTFVGFVFYGGGSWPSALLFSVPLMIILTAHEWGHYWQTRRYTIPASPP
ncbi:MAG: hypothetical protein IKY61_06940, partial [Thermoguttaceae bacterium]|nr:hypothetical protein [Thermoguttaceae bacterium]